jgi:XTP/dITP diphosphohydrolase
VTDPGAGGPGEGLRELVATMDRLRSPGGCPWDAAQTHESLVPFALEEAYEVAEAIEQGDRAGMREELGDLLLQVVFHARVAQEHATDPFDVDDVARGITAKLVRRHPHVFGAPAGGDRAGGLSPDGDLHVQWDRIKRAEKQRDSVLDGVPLALGALARGQKVLGRARRAGIELDGAAATGWRADAQVASPQDRVPGTAAAGWQEAEIGRRLLELVASADELGVDAEAALRAAVRGVEQQVRSIEGGPAAQEGSPARDGGPGSGDAPGSRVSP